MSQVTDPERSRGVIDPERSRRIRVRYAPSPTGVPHIGNIRTALFNYLFAKNQNGDFLLRIEDTDQKRLVPGSLEKIKESLERLNLNWDEYYVQSERLETYQKYLNELKDIGVVYEDEGAWRFKVEKGKTIQWDDDVHGTIQFASDVIEDFIIMKSDKFPTYHFANVIDDTEMKISHVLRGDEWLSSTPKHLMLYEAFGWQPPEFIHMPPILGPNKKKLSKRDGAKSVMEYEEEGYLPEAIINFMAFLGWSPKDEREIFSLEDLTKEFSIERINKNSPIFNLEKLKWFNMQWLKKLKPEEFDQKIQSQDQFKGKYSSLTTINIAPLVQGRIGTVLDFPKMTYPFYANTPPKVSGELMEATPISGPTISQYAQKLNSIETFSPENIKTGTAEFSSEHNVPTRDLYRSLGIATFGSLVTPPLPESVSIIGKDKTVNWVNELAKKKAQK